MTDLSNIFFGKKVVQKAYLNNALIYESKGWQTLPSTCTEVWTKSYEKVDNSGFRSIAKDDLDDLYIGIDQFLCKIDSDGKLIWKTNLLADKGSFKSSVIDSIILSKNYIYCAINYFEDSSNNWFYYLAKVDSNGNLINIATINSVMSNSNYGAKMVKDDLNIYAVSSNCLYKFDLDFKLIDYVTMSDSARCLTTNNGPYVFVGTYNYGIRFEKNNLKNSISLPGNNSSFYTGLIVMDNIGNLYLGSASEAALLKYDVENCKLITTLSLYDTFALCTDNQENVYFAQNSSTNTYQLEKYSSDGTLIWDNVPIPASNNNMKVITDNNNNIYVAYIDSNGMLTIKKFINLVKET